MRRRGHRGPPWPRELLCFDAADWAGVPDAVDLADAGYVPGVAVDGRVMEAVAVRRWSRAREGFAVANGLDYVVTLAGGRLWRRLAVLDGIVADPRERQPGWDRPA